ncbi:MAG: hypothetical protein WAT32_04960 [Candidatus Microthrix parvicella]|uniref:hypothetical protein n=1 Tax=Candidatus Neomicrothrix parvicella TaxID=41950 RepID=UPI0012FD2F77|nr:hypothetical protein [Candidatus Microthrix parvicella]
MSVDHHVVRQAGLRQVVIDLGVLDGSRPWARENAWSKSGAGVLRATCNSPALAI